MDDQSAAIAETIAQAEADARSKGLGEGDEMYSVDLAEGMTASRKKGRSMVHSNGVALPERLPFYHSRTGKLCPLPTAQLGHYLSKRFTDGSQVFVKERPFEEPAPLDKTCEVCFKAMRFEKKFYDEFDYISHMENKHPREWRIIQERERSSGSEFLKAVLTMDATQRQALKALLGGDDGNTQGTATASEGARASGVQQAEQGGTREPCPDCGKPVKPAGLKLHQSRYCENSGGGVGADAEQKAV